MPWYMNPDVTCRLLHRIADRHQLAKLRDLQQALDDTAQKIWSKQENYHKKKSAHRS